jgi:GNAT superfamily N-acetyltransferase
MMITTRKATVEDMPAVHDLVRELAVYEHAENELTATVEDYRRDFEAGIFNVILAEEEGLVVGIALYHFAYSTWKGRMMYLEDFVVTGSRRGQGIGKILFDAFLEECRVQECRVVKWQVLDWNEPALNFYKKYAAVIETNWWNGKIYTMIK